MNTIFRGDLGNWRGRARAWVDSLFVDHAVLRLVKYADVKSAQRLQDISLGLAAGRSDVESRTFWMVCAAYFEATALGLFADDITGTGQWVIAGTPIAPHSLACPTVDFVSLHDRIVPAASAAGFADRRELAAGHVGMIVGRGARAQLWEQLNDWISQAGGAR